MSGPLNRLLEFHRNVAGLVLTDLHRQAAQSEIEMPGFEQFWNDGHFEFPLPAEPVVPYTAFRAAYMLYRKRLIEK